MAYLSFLTIIFYVSWYGKELKEIIDREKKKETFLKELRKFRSNQIVAISISFET